MKRFWLVLLSLGLMVAFSTQAMAVDVKVAGSYYAAGMYLDKTGFRKNDTNVAFPQLQNSNPSTAFYFQRLRLGTEFVVAPGLNLITRADIMERAWGAARSAPAGGTRITGASPDAGLDTLSAGTRAENENIAFDWVYLSYVSPIGIFQVGYQQDRVWGTVFGDNSQPNPKIAYVTKVGNVALGAQIGKDNERSRTAINAANTADEDRNFYNLFAKYGAKNWEAGVLFKYVDERSTRNTWLLGRDLGVKTWALNSLPYAKAKFGPVALQTEIIWTYGTAKMDNINDARAILGAAAPENIDINQLAMWLDATADFSKFYVGGTFAYVSGDDPGTADKREGGLALGGLDYQPCLIMFNSDRNYWVGNLVGYDGSNDGNQLNNTYFAQMRGGVRPNEKFDVMMSASWAHVDKTPGGVWEGREHGWEIDVTGTYKITNNLSYMLGAGYWFVGNFYKGTTSTTHDLTDNYMVINKLTLTF